MPQRLARPVYEALPLLWVAAGLACIGGSYAWRAHALSGLLALLGLVALIVGLAVWMHRRDYRATSADYQLRGQPMPQPTHEPTYQATHPPGDEGRAGTPTPREPG